MESRKIGLYFGTFNPVHNGHLMIANYMAEFTDLNEVWFVISPLNPFKEEKDLLPDYHRLEMLIRATGNYPRFRVSSVEFMLPKPSFTIDTLAHLKTKYPDYQFIIIMGSDQLPDFHNWKKSDEILANYKILVYPRPDKDADGISSVSHELRNHPSITLVQAPMMDLSSSFIRQAVKQKKDVRFFMPELAWKYLDDMNFYK